MGVMSRANSRIPRSGEDRGWIDSQKDDLIRDQEPMAIVGVVYDGNGSSFGPRWVVTVGPWYEEQDGPNGLLSFTNSPLRQSVFEDLQAQLEENQDQPIGPVTLIKGKSQKGYRFYAFADYNENGEAENEQAGATPVTEPAPAPAPRPSRAVKPAMEIVSVGAQGEVVYPAPAKKRGRPSKADLDARRAAIANEVLNQPTKTPERPVAGVSQQLSVGSATCPHCGQEVKGRVLPDEQGNRFIIHPHCPVTNRPEVLAVTEEV